MFPVSVWCGRPKRYDTRWDSYLYASDYDQCMESVRDEKDYEDWEETEVDQESISVAITTAHILILKPAGNGHY